MGPARATGPVVHTIFGETKMDLLHVRQKFRDLSGRYDLVNADGSDNGANFFINEACRQLDRSIETQKSYGTYMEILAIGTWNVQFNRCRAVQEVWITTSEGKFS
jgi:hypothetical protein